MNRQSTVAMVVSLLAGTLVYLGFMIEEWAERLPAFSTEQLLVLLPAVIVALMFELFVILPLWMLLPRRRNKTYEIIFFGVSTLGWLIVSEFILRFATGEPGARVETDASVVLPGLMLIAAFHCVARHRSP